MRNDAVAELDRLTRTSNNTTPPPAKATITLDTNTNAITNNNTANNIANNNTASDC